jgi:small subunit ribosomal protein S14
MAKKGKVENNNKRIRLVARYIELRRELRSKVKNLRLPIEERELAKKRLAALPRNSAETRVRNRCLLTGRPRGVLSKFKLSRIKFRELALIGQIPGVTKSSW